MHYANGRAAKVGDLVRGKGYNIRHEIVGLLISANPGSYACNCSVATVSIGSQIKCHGWRKVDGALEFQREILADLSRGEPLASEVIATIEYGQLDAFVALDPETGEILPPEWPSARC